MITCHPSKPLYLLDPMEWADPEQLSALQLQRLRHTLYTMHGTGFSLSRKPVKEPPYTLMIYKHFPIWRIFLSYLKTIYVSIIRMACLPYPWNVFFACIPHQGKPVHQPSPDIHGLIWKYGHALWHGPSEQQGSGKACAYKLPLVTGHLRVA